MTTYIGIDWSREKHDVTFLNDHGREVLSLEIKQSVQGFQELEEKRVQLGVAPDACVFGIESAHTLLIDYLWARGYERVYVVPPGVTAANRGRNRQSGARNDRYDSRVIAETLRTDLAKFHPWHPGSELLQQMRICVSYGESLTKETVRNANRLEALLLRYYPAARELFSSWPTQIICHFLQEYPTPAQAAALECPTFVKFCRQHHYPKPRLLLSCYHRLQAIQPAPIPALVDAYASEVQDLAATLLRIQQNRKANLKRLNRLFEQHEDAFIFASLPGTGEWLAPALLVKFGEDRLRFPTRESLQALAGTCPVTFQSGKKRSVRMRRSCDHSFRQITQQWARAARTQSEWAAFYSAQVLDRNPSSNHADRCLANRLLAIGWRLWQSCTAYDEAIHLRNHLNRRKAIS